MKLKEFKCKNCGEIIKYDSNSEEIKCDHCLSLFKTKDIINIIKDEDKNEIDIESEKIKSEEQEENKSITSKNSTGQSKKKSNTFLLILAWIFLLPFTATYFIIKSKNINSPLKIILIIILWAIFIIMGKSDEQEQNRIKKEIITKCYSQETYNKLDELIGISNIRINTYEETECDKLEIKNSNYKKIIINTDEEKNLESIIVDSKYIYGAKEDSNDQNKEDNNSQNEKEKESSKKNKKADYEFDTIKGYTTLQSLLININKNDTYKKIKNMAGYYDYYVKNSTGAEANGTIVIIFNTSYENFQNNYTNSYTESVEIRFDGFSKKSKIYYYEYQVSDIHYEYNYYKEKGLVSKYGEESTEYNKPIDAFKYINQRIGFNG